jgi:ergothioneine biosynthesis protein EgtB
VAVVAASHPKKEGFKAVTSQAKTEQVWGESPWTGGEELAKQFRDVRQLTTQLSERLEVEDCVAQSMADASPTKWHLAHTTWFFEKFVLERYDDRHKPFHSGFNYQFNSYYNAIGERVKRPMRGLMTRPTLDEVRRYRRHIDDAVTALLDRSQEPDSQRIRSLIEIGLHHEQQHQELLLTDIKHLFSLNPLKPAYQEQPMDASAQAGPMRWISFDEGIRWIGHGGDGFAYDNECPRHRVFLEAFQIADRLVTNREYLAFIADGGYSRPELWLDEGWATVHAEEWLAPLYWHRADDGWQIFTLAGLRPLDPDEPVCHVSFYEAHAFAWWAGYRLPSESEWETACGEPPRDGNFVEDGRYHPASCARSADGAVRQALGDAWEWTQSAYRPYPGYRAASGALGEYNGKFMCNQFVLRGGSCCTPRRHIRPTYRNFFYAPARWQFSGIRLAKDA